MVRTLFPASHLTLSPTLSASPASSHQRTVGWLGDREEVFEQGSVDLSQDLFASPLACDIAADSGRGTPGAVTEIEDGNIECIPASPLCTVQQSPDEKLKSPEPECIPQPLCSDVVQSTPLLNSIPQLPCIGMKDLTPLGGEFNSIPQSPCIEMKDSTPLNSVPQSPCIEMKDSTPLNSVPQSPCIKMKDVLHSTPLEGKLNSTPQSLCKVLTPLEEKLNSTPQVPPCMEMKDFPWSSPIAIASTPNPNSCSKQVASRDLTERAHSKQTLEVPSPSATEPVSCGERDLASHLPEASTQHACECSPSPDAEMPCGGAVVKPAGMKPTSEGGRGRDCGVDVSSGGGEDILDILFMSSSQLESHISTLSTPPEVPEASRSADTACNAALEVKDGTEVLDGGDLGDVVAKTDGGEVTGGLGQLKNKQSKHFFYPNQLCGRKHLRSARACDATASVGRIPSPDNIEGGCEVGVVSEPSAKKQRLVECTADVENDQVDDHERHAMGCVVSSDTDAAGRIATDSGMETECTESAMPLESLYTTDTAMVESVASQSVNDDTETLQFLALPLSVPVKRQLRVPGLRKKRRAGSSPKKLSLGCFQRNKRSPLVLPEPEFDKNFDDEQGEGVRDEQHSPVLAVGFRTAAGSVISVSESALDRARKLVEEEEDPVTKDDVQPCHLSGGSMMEDSTSGFVGFQTAAGGAISISELALTKAKKFVEGEEPVTNDDTQIHDEFASVEQSNGKFQGFAGFQTAAGRKISVSESSLDRARKLLEEEGESVALSCNLPGVSSVEESTPGFAGFQTAAGRAISVSESSLDRARKLLLEEEGLAAKTVTQSRHLPGVSSVEDSAPGFMGFQTAAGRAISVLEAALDRAEQEENSTAKDGVQSRQLSGASVELASGKIEGSLPGFKTASGNLISISELALERARKLISEKETKVDTGPEGDPQQHGPQHNLISLLNFAPTNSTLLAGGSKTPSRESSRQLSSPATFPRTKAPFKKQVLSSKGKGFKAPRKACNVSQDEEKSSLARILRNFSAKLNVREERETRLDSGFATANGKRLTVSSCAVLKAERMLAEDKENIATGDVEAMDTGDASQGALELSATAPRPDSAEESATYCFSTQVVRQLLNFSSSDEDESCREDPGEGKAAGGTSGPVGIAADSKGCALSMPEARHSSQEALSDLSQCPDQVLTGQDRIMPDTEGIEAHDNDNFSCILTESMIDNMEVSSVGLGAQHGDDDSAQMNTAGEKETDAGKCDVDGADENGSRISPQHVPLSSLPHRSSTIGSRSPGQPSPSLLSLPIPPNQPSPSLLSHPTPPNQPSPSLLSHPIPPNQPSPSLLSHPSPLNQPSPAPLSHPIPPNQPSPSLLCRSQPHYSNPVCTEEQSQLVPYSPVFAATVGEPTPAGDVQLISNAGSQREGVDVGEVEEGEQHADTMPGKADKEFESLIHPQPFPGLQTGSGKRVEVSSESIRAARAALGDAEPSPVDRGPFPSLQTASGKRVEVSSESIRAARAALGDSEPILQPFPGLQTASGKKVEISSESVRAAKAALGVNESSGTHQPFPSLQTAGGKRVEISSESMKAARAALGDTESSATLQPFLGLQTAAGKRVEISRDSIRAARAALGDTESSPAHCQPFPGLQTASGKGVEISRESIRAARVALGDTELIPTPHHHSFADLQTPNPLNMSITEARPSPRSLRDRISHSSRGLTSIPEGMCVCVFTSCFSTLTCMHGCSDSA